MALSIAIGKSGQLLHKLPPATVKSTISDVVMPEACSELDPVVTRILETMNKRTRK